MALNPVLNRLIAQTAANEKSSEDGLRHLRDMAERRFSEIAEFHRSLAEAYIREREAEVEVRRAKAERTRLQDRVRLAETECHRVCQELDKAEWQAKSQRVDASAERAAA